MASIDHFSRLSPELQDMWKNSFTKHEKSDPGKEFNAAVYRVAPHIKDKEREDLAYNDETRQQEIEDKIAGINQINKNMQQYQSKYGHFGGRKSGKKRNYKKRSHKKRSNKKRSYKKRNY